MDLPPFVTAATGMDALTHNMEAYIAKNWHPICDGIAPEGMATIAAHIEKGHQCPRRDFTRLHAAGFHDGRHCLPEGTRRGAFPFPPALYVVGYAPRGLGNAVNLPYGMKFNYEGQRRKIRSHGLGFGSQSGKDLPEFLFELNDQVGIPRKLGQIGVKEEHLEPLADLAVTDFAHPNNPKPRTREDFLRLYKEAL